MRLTRDNVINICLKIVLPVCVMFQIAMWKIDSSTVFMVAFILCNILRYKIVGELTKIDLVIAIIMSVSNIIHVSLQLGMMW